MCIFQKVCKRRLYARAVNQIAVAMLCSVNQNQLFSDVQAS